MAVPMASAGSAGSRRPIVGDSTALEGELLEGKKVSGCKNDDLDDITEWLANKVDKITADNSVTVVLNEEDVEEEPIDKSNNCIPCSEGFKVIGAALQYIRLQEVATPTDIICPQIWKDIEVGEALTDSGISKGVNQLCPLPPPIIPSVSVVHPKSKSKVLIEIVGRILMCDGQSHNALFNFFVEINRASCLRPIYIPSHSTHDKIKDHSQSYGFEKPTKVDIEATAEPEPQYLVLRTRARRVTTATTVCLFLTALLVMTIGIIGGVYLYRQFARAQMHRFRGWCSIPYDGTKATLYSEQRNAQGQHHDSAWADSNMFKASYTRSGKCPLNRSNIQATAPSKSLNIKKKQESLSNSGNLDEINLDKNIPPEFFEEKFEIDLENENFEKIDVPDFRDGRRGRFIHDFNSNKTGIIDLDGQRCFVMPLNRNRVLPPRSLFDLIKKMWDGYYEVNTDVVRETMRVVTPAITDFKNVGYYITRECRDAPTYLLEKVVTGVYKRSVPDATFAVFAGDKIFQVDIVNMPNDLAGLDTPEIV
uniref:BRICHOS domain-containing protein n=2 Tax=Timema TaxID=61471 RepID=A0A7R9HSP1_9NEOP|nr:unnamed protein product [Timema monikensis]